MAGDGPARSRRLAESTGHGDSRRQHHVLFRPGTGVELTPLPWQHHGPEVYDENNQSQSDHEPILGRFRIAPKAQENYFTRAARPGRHWVNSTSRISNFAWSISMVWEKV